MTASELDMLINAGRRAGNIRILENELLAYNIGALVLTAFNAPMKYPATPSEAFGRSPSVPSDGGAEDFMKIAAQLNGRLKFRQEKEYDGRGA